MIKSQTIAQTLYARGFRVVSGRGRRQALMQEAASILVSLQGRDGFMNEGSRGGVWMGVPVARLERIVDLLEDIEISNQGE